MTATGSALADALNATFGLDLASFVEAKQWLESPEGQAAVDAWRDEPESQAKLGTSPGRMTT